MPPTSPREACWGTGSLPWWTAPREGSGSQEPQEVGQLLRLPGRLVLQPSIVMFVVVGRLGLVMAAFGGARGR